VAVLDHSNLVIDAVVAASVISSPLWVQQIEIWLQFFTVVGGFLLVAWRLWVVRQDVLDRRVMPPSPVRQPRAGAESDD
jgi:hypothetical protein